jgi:hypothetical protein
MHRASTQMDKMCHECGGGICRCRVVRAKAVRVILVARIQCAGDGSGHPDSVSEQRILRVTEMIGQTYWT